MHTLNMTSSGFTVSYNVTNEENVAQGIDLNEDIASNVNFTRKGKEKGKSRGVQSKF